jgi:hypothetical protein
MTKKARAANGRGADLKIEDLFVRRTAEGEIVPISVEVPGLNGKKIKVLPTTIGSVKGLQNLDKDAVTWPIEEKVRYVREHVVDPALSEVTMDEIIDNMTMWDLDMVLVAAIQAGSALRRQQQGKG